MTDMQIWINVHYLFWTSYLNDKRLEQAQKNEKS